MKLTIGQLKRYIKEAMNDQAGAGEKGTKQNPFRWKDIDFYGGSNLSSMKGKYFKSTDGLVVLIDAAYKAGGDIPVIQYLLNGVKHAFIEENY